jgi:glutathione S-transferase
MQAHLDEISVMLAPDAHALLVLDQVGWHLAGALFVPEIITLRPLPPRSLELNPVENVWQVLRDNHLSNRVFKGHDDIDAHCSHARNGLMDQPWGTRSIGRRPGRRVLISGRGYQPELAPTQMQLSADTPTMQVPTLRHGDIVLSESGTIAEYLLSTFSTRTEADPPLASAMWRPTHEWEDKLLFSTIQTLGTAVTTISQLTWTGVTIRENAHLQRCAERAQLILKWLEDRLPDEGPGFVPGVVTVQDIFLACHIRFVQARPLGLAFDLAERPKIAALLDQLDGRHSFIANPIRWWDPDVAGHSEGSDPIHDEGG